MDFDLTEDELAWRDEVRTVLAQHAADGTLAVEIVKRGWNALTWPKEYGGLELSPLKQMILTEEFIRADVPPLDVTVTMLAPVIIEHGTEANKRTWLPGIKRGEIRFALGYSEPEAGTDLASLRTRARLDGDEWVINGQKSWNSHAHTATHEWLAVRTDPDAPPHRGISVIMVPIDAPGVEVVAVETWGDKRTNDVFFTDVRVPRENLIGEVNRGWDYIVAALDNERAVLATTATLRTLLDELIAESKRTRIDGQAVHERPDVRRRLAELEVEFEATTLLGLEVVSCMEAGTPVTIPATMQKVMTTELRTKLADAGMSIFGLRGQIKGGDPLAPVDGAAEWTYRQAPFWRFGGGTNEVMRDIIAQRGCGLPKTRRR